MNIRWKYSENGRWSRWIDIDKTRKWIPETIFAIEMSENLPIEDAKAFFPGMFKSLRADYKEHLKKLRKAKRELKKQTGMVTSGELKV